MTVDNEQGRATGWLPGQLSGQGRLQAQALGRRRSGDQITAVFSSDLARAAETTLVAFAGTAIPVLYDWRLRECDYGQRNGMPAAELHAGRREHLDQPYPGRESWRQAIARVGRFLGDLPLRWDGRRVLVIGHVATRWALDHFIGGVPLEDLIEQDFAWQEGWEYQVSQPPLLASHSTAATATRLAELPVIDLGVGHRVRTSHRRRAASTHARWRGRRTSAARNRVVGYWPGTL